MLKKIPGIISPDLMKIMMEMGHGDELVLADRNFPASANARRLIRYDGVEMIPLLKAILEYFPLDYRVNPVAFMKGPDHSDGSGGIQKIYMDMCTAESINRIEADYEDRDAFYERSSKAYAIVATGETKRFANIIIRKGVVPEIRR